MKFAFFILGIKHQTIDKYSPWQNGRIERFFGTFKSHLNLLKYDEKDLYYLSYSFQWWYNNIRPHQNLGYQSPEAVYQTKVGEMFNRADE